MNSLAGKLQIIFQLHKNLKSNKGQGGKGKSHSGKYQPRHCENKQLLVLCRKGKSQTWSLLTGKNKIFQLKDREKQLWENNQARQKSLIMTYHDHFYKVPKVEEGGAFKKCAYSNPVLSLKRYLEFIGRKASRWTEGISTTTGKYLNQVSLAQVYFSSALSASSTWQCLQQIMLCPKLSCQRSASGWEGTTEQLWAFSTSPD